MVTRINIHSGSCVQCGKRISGTPPAGMLPDSPFGSGIAALAIYLHTRHMVSYNHLVEMFKGLIGLEISEGAMANIFSSRLRAVRRGGRTHRCRGARGARDCFR